MTLFEAIDAADHLSKAGINARVLDLYTIKPIDAEGILKNASECGGRVIVVEDHYPEGTFYDWRV